MNNSIKVGFALCGSFCTFNKAISQMKNLCDKGYDVIPIMSETAASKDTRFGLATDFVEKIESICNKHVIKTIEDAEPIGPKALTDIMVIAPCTGNTLSKLSNAITDTTVTMAAKSHLRQQNPLLIALSTNDALGATAQNLGRMLNVKNVFFVPMSQDDPQKKPNSIVADMNLLQAAIDSAINGQQIEPVFL